MATHAARMSYLEGVDEHIQRVVDLTDNPHPAVSVVVVTYCRNEELISCLMALDHQTYGDFETILVDNGGNEAVQARVHEHPVRHVRLTRNLGPSAARNVGIQSAKGQVVVFLDDDLIAAPDLVEAHVRAHDELDIVALRGKCLPKTRTICNLLQFHYDLGTQVRPAVMNLEGNSSYNRDVLVRVGGFNPDFFGHEELELTYRLVTELGIDRSRLVYYPEAVGYHDYCDSFSQYQEKRSRHYQMWENLVREHPGVEDFVASYRAGSSLRPWSSLPRRMWGLAMRIAVNSVIDLASSSGRRRPASDGDNSGH